MTPYLLAAALLAGRVPTTVVHRVEVHYDRAKDALTFSKAGIPVRLNDVVTVKVVWQKGGGKPFEYARWEGEGIKTTSKTSLIFFKDTKKDGYTVRTGIEGRLGEQFVIRASYADETEAAGEVRPGPPLRLVSAKAAGLLRFDGKAGLAPPELKTLYGEPWKVEPRRVDIGNHNEHWFTLEVTVQR